MSLRPTLYIDSTECTTELCLIGGKNYTDKSPLALNSACSKHRKGYTAVYEMLFAQYKNKPLNFAEIGIEAGASLLTWNQFFSQQCKVFAFEYDISKIGLAKLLNLDNISYCHTDTGNIEYLDETFKRTNVMFDIVIDDSLHDIVHQNNIIKATAKYIKPGGMLIIEDIMRDRHINAYEIDLTVWEFHTFIICHHNNRFCYDNDKILYLVKR